MDQNPFVEASDKITDHQLVTTKKLEAITADQVITVRKLKDRKPANLE